MEPENKKYNVIYADPPWVYKAKASVFKTIRVNRQYDLLSMEELKSLGVFPLIQDNAVLFIWATVPLLPMAFELLTAWGFEYKTMLTWHKTPKKLFGFWFMHQCEHLLLGVRGKVKCFRMKQVNFYESRTGRHSQKPPYFRELITEATSKVFASPVKLELFARSRAGFFPDYEYEGWDVYGNEVNNSIVLPETINKQQSGKNEGGDQSMNGQDDERTASQR